MREHLERLHKGQPTVITALSYDEAMTRATLAAEFVQQPYWDIMSRMLSGTIQNETEQLLTGDEHMAVNRASVAICRKVIQMPFFDIEQGRMADELYKKAKRTMEKRSNNQGAHSAEA